MSHFTKIDRANIVDVDAFISACNELGLTSVRRNCQIKDYYGQMVTVDVAVNVGQYDIALSKNAAGTYDMIADWWGVRRCELPKKLAECKSDTDLQDLILKHTTAQTVIGRYKRQGYRVNVYEDAEQNLQIELHRVR